MGEEELRELAVRVVRAGKLHGMQFLRQRYAAHDLLISLKPNLGGGRTSQPYNGESYDPNHARVVKAGWDHEHCFMCRARVVPGDEWWAALPLGHLGLCLACYDQLLILRQDPRFGRATNLEDDHPRHAGERNAAMTEVEWLSSTVPRAMLMALEDRANAREIDRKLRLFACACARRVRHLLVDERSVEAIEVAERYADGLADAEELDSASYESGYAASDLYVSGGLSDADAARERDPKANESHAGVGFGERAWVAARAAERVTARKVGSAGTKTWYEGGAWVAALTVSMSASEAIAGAGELQAREAPYEAASAALSAPLSASDAIAGAAELEAREEVVQDAIEARRLYEEPWQADLLRCIFGHPFRTVAIDPTWLTPNLKEQARLIYDRRSFDQLSALADALEDAGCRDAAVLDHCRRPGEHARGCWVIDAVLGKG